MPDDKIQREIEDILSRLDDFVPEDSPARRARQRSTDAASAIARAIIAPLTRISLSQVMLAALIIVVIGFVGMRVQPLYGRWLIVGGVILLLTSFGLSFVSKGPAPATDKRWRGRPIELNEPGLAERLRDWIRSRRRRRD